jgi:hypothetical protein
VVDTNTAAATVGYPFLFYQKLWDILKSDLVKLLEEFHKGDLVGVLDRQPTKGSTRSR